MTEVAISTPQRIRAGPAAPLAVLVPLGLNIVQLHMANLC